MEPWENEAERSAWRRALTALGAIDRQADVGRLVHAGLENKEIAARLGASVSTVKADIQVLFGILGVVRRKRQILGRFARRAVDAALAPRRSAMTATPPPPPIVPLPLPQPTFRSRKARGGSGQSGRRAAPDGREERPRS